MTVLSALSAVESVSRLLRDRRFDEVDELFESIIPAETPLELSVGLLRLTLPLRDRLKWWLRFYHSTHHEIRRRGESPVLLLRGLR
jgi:hypothetical protein